MDFVCFSVNNWEKRRARKQQFMLHLSKREDVGKVLYIEPPLNFFRLIFFPWIELKTTEGRRRWRRALVGALDPVTNKLWVATPIFFIPFSFRVNFFYKANLYLTNVWVARIARQNHFQDIVLWLYHPLDEPLLRWFKERRVACFDWAEEWTEYFKEFTEKGRGHLKKAQEAIIAGVDCVFVVSKRLLDKAKTLNPNSYFIHDGVIPEIFSAYKGAIPQDLKNIKHPIIGYSGTFYDRVDIDLVKSLSRALPDCSLVFVGNIQHDRVDITSLKGASIKNIYFLGVKDYEELPGYLMNFDVCILPYYASQLISSPTKIYDYLACGKPVVATGLSELEYLREWVKLADSGEKFIQLVKESLFEKDSVLIQKRIQKARENSWAVHAEEIIGIVGRRI